MAPQSEDARAIDGVATSIAAFVGRAQRGPVDEPVIVTSFVEFETKFGGLWTESALAHSVRDFFHLGGTTAVIVRVHQTAPDDTALVVLGTESSRLTLEAASPGAWGSQLSVVIDGDVTDPSDPTLFNLTVVDERTRRIELFRDVSFATASPRRVDAVVEQQSKLVRIPGALPSAAPAVYPERVTATGGNDGGLLGAANYTTAADLRTDHRGLYALDRADPINLIVIPPYTVSGDVDDQVITDTIAYAEERRAVLIMDPPSTWDTAAAAISGASAPSFPVSSHAAIYYPRIRPVDPVGDHRPATLAPSGAVAGVIARTDARRGVWKAPAGVSATLDGVSELALSLNDEQIGELTELGVNCLKAVTGAGYVIWGARTREGAEQLGSKWKYLQVRRMALFIEDSLHRGLQWVSAEPNDEPLWSQIRLSVGAFLDDLFREGAFSGMTPTEAYFVRCDADTTTPEDTDRGVVNIEVGFAPLKPAEFVVLGLELEAGQRRVRWWRRRR